LRADEPVRVTFRPLSFSTVPGRSVIVPMFERAPMAAQGPSGPSERAAP
jgi:hypothetical protein